MRPVIYQLFVRHFSNMEMHGVDWGSREENGCGTFNGVTDKALREIARMGFTHIWLTGVLRHATQTAHPGLPAQPESIVKGLAGRIQGPGQAVPDRGTGASHGLCPQPCLPRLPGGLGRP